MATLIKDLIKELHIDLDILKNLFNVLGYKGIIEESTLIPDYMTTIAKRVCSKDSDFFKLIEILATEKKEHKNQTKPVSRLKICGYIDLDDKTMPNRRIEHSQNIDFTPPPIKYDNKESFWIDKLAILSPENNVNYIALGSFNKTTISPIYSLLIGINGVGKSSLLKEIVDFFIDLHECINNKVSSSSSAKNGRLRGIIYHIDGIKCEVIKIEKNYYAKIDGHIHPLNDLRLPYIVACHFGAFGKFPTQKINGSGQTKYDVPYYKYVGAHINGNMISSSAITFRLLFALIEHMDHRQRKNICSVLDFIGYDHTISLSYSLVSKSKKNGTDKDIITRFVEKDREYHNLSKKEKIDKINQIHQFYSKQSSTKSTQFNLNFDFDSNNTSKNLFNTLQNIYKLKQYNLVSSTNTTFHKQGCNITSDEMSSGEFAMLSTILSISAAAKDPHTLILLDEPELSLHPNWQMTLINNLDKALSKQVCHLLIATHSHMLVSDLPNNRSSVTHIEKDEKGDLTATVIPECTYGWSAEEVLLKVFNTATDRNRYFGERISKLLEKMGNNTIKPHEVADELDDLQEISKYLSDIDPMKTILNTIIDAYR